MTEQLNWNELNLQKQWPKTYTGERKASLINDVGDAGQSQIIMKIDCCQTPIDKTGSNGLNACMLSRFSHVWFFETLWTVAHQDPQPMGILQARIVEWAAMLSSRGSSRPRDWTCVSYISCIAGGFFITEPPGNGLDTWMYDLKP